MNEKNDKKKQKKIFPSSIFEMFGVILSGSLARCLAYLDLVYQYASTGQTKKKAREREEETKWEMFKKTKKIARRKKPKFVWVCGCGVWGNNSNNSINSSNKQ